MTQINLDIINGQYKVWNKGFNEYTSINISEIKKLFNDNVKKICELDVLSERIGSESTKGYVFKTHINVGKYRIPFALKILPIFSDEDVENNKKEISIANMMSNKVLNKECVNFPILFAYGTCNDYTYHMPMLQRRAEIYFLVKELLKSKDVSNEFKYELENNYELYKKLYNDSYREELINEFNITLITPVNYIISELGISDLRIFIENGYLNKDNVHDILQQVNDGLNCMNDVIHGDLHTGNVLLLNREEMVFAIHDFGKSEFIEDSEINEIFDIIEWMKEDLIKSENYTICQKRTLMNILDSYL